MEEREREIADAPVRTGILDVLPEGYGFLRTSGYLPGPTDITHPNAPLRPGRVRETRFRVGIARTLHPSDFLLVSLGALCGPFFGAS